MSESTPLILVVDDNEMNRDMLSRRLQRHQYSVLMAEDGLVALEMVKQHHFDLIMLDIMMPNISGYEVLERLKADTSTRHLPVIMISAVDDLDSVVKCIELGAEDYLFKPFNPVLLKARVGAILSRRSSALAPKQVREALQAAQAALSQLNDTALSDVQRNLLERAQASIQQLSALNGTT